MRHWLRTQPLTLILSIVLSAIILAGLATNAWVTYNLVNYGEKKLILDKFKTMDNISVQLLETYFQVQQHGVKNIAHQIADIEHDWADAQHFPAGFLQRFLRFEPKNVVAITTTQKKIFAHQLSDREQQHFRQQLDSFTVDLNTRTPYWYAHTEETGKNTLFYIYPRDSHIPSKIQTLILRVHLARLDFLEPEQYLVSKTGKILTAHHQHPEFTTRARLIAEHLHHNGLIALPQGYAHFSKIHGTDLTLVHFIPKSQVQNLAKPLLQNLVHVWLAILACILLMHYYIFKKVLVTPLENFLNILESLNPRALTRRLPPLEFKEPEQVRVVFNRLLDALLSYQNELEAKITERTQALDNAKKQAELANARKSLHLSSVSHELRTPLNGILGHLQLLEVDPDATAKQQKRFAHAKKSSLDLLELVENLLDFSRIERGELKLTPAPLDLYAFLEHIGSTVAPLAQQKQITLQVIVSKQVPIQLQTDRARLKQILLNLLGNSLKFTQRGHIRLHVFTSIHTLHFSVLDTGLGMEKSALKDIFQPFIQLDDALSGIGLGLNISQQLAEKMGGALRVRSKKNAYTCFCLDLPLDTTQVTGHNFAPLSVRTRLPLQRQLACWGIVISEKSPQVLSDPHLLFSPQTLYNTLRGFQNPALEKPQPAPSMQTQSPWQLKVLVVDDVAMNRDIAAHMLEALGHRVYSAESGQAALTLGKKNIFDWVLLDMRMPEMSGLETLQQWRTGEDILDSECFIALLTANAMPEEETRAKAAGVQDYLIKPIDWEQLQETTQAVIDFQFNRGVDLTPNPQRKTAVLDINQDTLWKALEKELLQLEQQLQGENTQQEKIDIVHKIAGLMGHAGLEALYQTAQYYEKQLYQGQDVAYEDLKALLQSIKAHKL